MQEVKHPALGGSIFEEFETEANPHEKARQKLVEKMDARLAEFKSIDSDFELGERKFYTKPKPSLKDKMKEQKARKAKRKLQRMSRKQNR